MSTSVIRTTTDKLEAVIAEQESQNRELMSSQFIGGRDWVLFFAQMITLTTVMSTTGRIRDEPTISQPFLPGVDGKQTRETASGILVGTYSDTSRRIHDDGSVTPLSHMWSGWIEDEQETWIIYLDGFGRPALYWPKRDADGGVIGEPLDLAAA